MWRSTRTAASELCSNPFQHHSCSPLMGTSHHSPVTSLPVHLADCLQTVLQTLYILLFIYLFKCMQKHFYFLGTNLSL